MKPNGLKVMKPNGMGKVREAYAAVGFIAGKSGFLSREISDHACVCSRAAGHVEHVAGGGRSTTWPTATRGAEERAKGGGWSPARGGTPPSWRGSASASTRA